MNKIVSITLFSFLTLLLILFAFSASQKVKGEALRHIDLQGCNLLSKAEYFTFAGIKSDEDLKYFTLATLREKFLQHPYIKNVAVVEDADNNALVTLYEKTFAATAVIKDKLFLVTAKKEFLPLLANTKVVDFPVLTNLPRNEGLKELQNSTETENAFSIIRFAKKLDNIFCSSISEINLRESGDIVLTMNHANAVVLIGKQQLEEKIYSLNELMKQVGNKVAVTSANYIDLRYTGNIFVGTNGNTGI